MAICFNFLPMESDLGNLLLRCKEAGLRKTRALESLLKTMFEKNLPVTLTDLVESPLLKEQCDKVTIYRLLQRLSEHAVVRRIGLHERSAYFILLLPDVHRDYLVCKECNHIQPIDAPCPVHKLEKEIAKSSGYSDMFHELEFFGVCPDCTQRASA